MLKYFMQNEIELLESLGYTVKQESLNGYLDYAFKEEAGYHRMISRSPEGFLATVDSDIEEFDEERKLKNYFNKLQDACQYLNESLIRH